jgi:hypothetical protein
VHRARRVRSRAAALTHKIKWSHCYFFLAVVIRMQCGSIRDCTAPIRHPLKLGGQQWRRREKRKLRRRSRRRRRLARRSSRRYRSSASHVLKIASHGPASVEGEMIFRDRPAQVNDRGRRRDVRCRLQHRINNFADTLRGGEDERRDNRISPWRKASGFALQPSRRRPRFVGDIVSKLSTASWSNPRRRFSLPRCAP